MYKKCSSKVNSERAIQRHITIKWVNNKDSTQRAAGKKWLTDRDPQQGEGSAFHKKPRRPECNGMTHLWLWTKKKVDQEFYCLAKLFSKNKEIKISSS